MKQQYILVQFKWVLIFFLFYFPLQSSFGQAFTEEFNDNTGVSTSVSKMLAGVQFDFVFESRGAGGDMAWESGNGFEGSASLNLASTYSNLGEVEQFTISRSDGEPFYFTSIFVNNTAGKNVFIQGYLNGVEVGTYKEVPSVTGGTIAYNRRVDEIRFTTTEFLNTNIDSFKGSLIPNNPPTASSFTAANGPYENLTYTFSTANFGYSDSDGNPLSHIVIESIPGEGTLYVDADNDDAYDGGEEVIPNEQISKADLDAGNLQYIQNGIASTSFQFEVNDGTVNSSGDYIATLILDPVPPVLLSISPATRGENLNTETLVTATLFNTYGENTIVNLGFSGTATFNSDYYASGSSIIIPAGSLTGTIGLINSDDNIYEGNETAIIDITSVSNGVELGTQQVSYTIVEDDPIPTVSLELLDTYNPITNEAGGQAYVTARLSGLSKFPVSVPFTFSGTATGGGVDYGLTNTTIPIAPGAIQGSLRVTSYADTYEEGDETIIFTMDTPTNAQKGSPDEVTLTIIDANASAPTGYDVFIHQDPINSSNSSNVSFNFSNAEIGATYTYIFSTSGGASTVSGSGNTITSSDYITGINLSGLEDGEITLSATLTDMYGNTGDPATATSTKLSTNAPVATVPSISGVQEDVIYYIPDGLEVTDADGDELTLTFTVIGGTVTLGTTGITFGGSGNGTNSFTASGSIVELNAALDVASFISELNLNGTDAGTISFVANDGTTDSNVASVTFDIEPVNDAPVFVGGANSISYTENGPPTSFNSGGIIRLTEPDGEDLIEATITIEDYVSGDILTMVTPGPYAVSQMNDVITLSGTGSVAQMITALGSIEYSHNGDDPTVGGTDNARNRITIVVKDASGLSSNTFAYFVRIYAVNDDPTFTGLPTDISVFEGQASTIDLSSATFGDVDSGSGDVTLSFVVSEGSLSATSTTDVTVSFPGSGTMNLEGTAAAIEAFLSSPSSIQYTNSPGVTGDNAATLSISANDHGNTGSGGGLPVDFGMINIDVEALLSFAINDVSVAEGDAGTTSLQFTVSLNAPAPAGGATVDYSTSNGSAVAGSDYIAASGTLSFAAGETSKTINISVIGDETVEMDETFTLTLSNPTGTNVAIADFNGIGTIQNDDTAQVTISDVSGNEDDGAITLTATLDQAVEGGFTLDVSTADGTATVADNDYNPITGQTLTFAGTAGEIQTFTVTPTLDLLEEGDETLTVSLSNLASTSLTVDISDDATVTILNDDSRPSGYSVAWDDLLINAAEAANTSFTVSNAQVGATIFYRISSSADANLSDVTGSRLVENSSQVVSVDVSTLLDGTLVVECYLQDAGGNRGPTIGNNSTVLDQTAPSAPGTPDLAPGSDSGASASDNITNDLTPTFTGTALPGSVVTLISDVDGALGVTTANGSGNWTYTAGSNVSKGIHVMTATQSDLAGNVSPASSGLSVTFDVNPPSVILKPGTTNLTLNQDGISPTLTVSELLYFAIFDDFTPQGNIQSSLSKSVFNCSDVGTNSVTVTVTDLAGNSWIGNASVNVVDETKPTIQAKSTITLNVDAFGTVDLTAGMIDEGSTDACGIQSQVLSKTSFSKTDEGSNTVKYTVTDVNGNSSEVDIEVIIVVVPKVLNVTVDPGQSKVYGDLDPAYTYQASGFESGDGVGILTGALSRDSGSDVGTYAITLGTLDAGPNYTINFTGSDFEITSAPLNVTAINNSKVYGDADPTFVFVASGLKNGDPSSTITGALGRAAGEDVGIYAINQGTLDAGPNYSINFATANFEITPAILDITADAGQNKVYGQVDPELTYQYSGLKNGDTKEGVITGALARATGEDIGTYPINQGSLDAGSNYTINFIDEDFVITQGTINGITFDNASFVYDGTEKSLAITGPLPMGTHVNYSNNGRTDVGTQQVTATISGSNFTTLVLTADLTVTPGTITGISFDDASFVYDGSEKSLAITGTLPGGTIVNYSNNGRTDVGTQQVTATISGSNFTTLVLTADLTVTPGTITGISFDDASFVYDGSEKSLAITGTLPVGTIVNYSNNGRTDVGTQQVTATISGSNFTTLVLTADLTVTPGTITGITFDDASFVYDGTEKSLAITGTLPVGTIVNYSNNGRTDVGTQQVTATISGSNFTTLVLTADLTVTPGTITGITFDDASFVYDGTEKSLAITGTLPVGTIVNYSNNGRTDVGTQQVTATISGSNFTTVVLTADLTVSSVTLDITADVDQSKIYGDPDPEFTFVADGFEAGDDIGILTGSLSRATGEEVGSYPITLGTLDAGPNYTINFTAANFEINQATLDITVDAGQSKVYGDADPAFTYQYTGLKNGDTYTVITGVLARAAGQDVGMYPINVGTLDAGPNYTINFIGADFEITQATLDITVDAGQRKVYGEADPAFTYQYTGLKNGDTNAVITGALARAAGQDVGMYPINVGTLDAGPNYVINFTSADFAITPATLTVTANAGQTKIYGDADPAFTYQYSGLKNGYANAVITGALARAAGQDVGAYAINLGTLDAGPNYTINFTGAAFMITPRTLNITANSNQVKVYGSADPTFSYMASNFGNGDNTSILTGALSRVAGEDVGMYAITIGTLDAGSNYVINFTSADFEIAEKVLDVTADAGQSKVFGTADPTLTYQVTGFENGDDETILTGALARAAGENVGSYAINLGTLDAGSNYAINYTGASFTITKAMITGITFADDGFVFDGTEKSLAITGTLPAGTSVAYTNNGRTDVGSQTVTATITGSNYTSLELTADLTITAKDITVTADAGQSKIAGEADPILTYTATGLADGEGMEVFAGSLSRVAGEEVGMYAITQGSLTTGGNYTITFIGADFEIIDGDTDGDGVPDLEEEKDGTDPADPTDFKDTDGDGVPDYVETEQEGTDPADPEDYKDQDGDQVPDYVEEREGTDPNDSSDYKDADGDGVPDYIQERSISELVAQSIQVAWNTPQASLNLPTEAMAITGLGEMVNVPVTWDLSGYDPLISGTTSYEGMISTIPGIFNTYELTAELNIEILAKPALTDVILSENEFIGIPDQYFQEIGFFSVIDATDDQHSLSLPEGMGDNELFEVIDGILFWSSQDQRAGETRFEVVLEVEDRAGNVIQKTFLITRLRTPLSDLDVVNTFTPNADGVNDTWGVPALRYYRGSRIQVFDRGGKRLFYTEDPDVRWDGTFEGEEMGVGAYYWVIEVEETGEVRRGVLNLLRQ